MPDGYDVLWRAIKQKRKHGMLGLGLDILNSGVMEGLSSELRK